MLRDFISGTNIVSLSLTSPRLVISSRFIFFNNKSFTALKPHSAKYEDEKGNSNFFAKLVVRGYSVSVSSQSWLYVGIHFLSHHKVGCTWVFSFCLITKLVVRGYSFSVSSQSWLYMGIQFLSHHKVGCTWVFIFCLITKLVVHGYSVSVSSQSWLYMGIHFLSHHKVGCTWVFSFCLITKLVECGYSVSVSSQSHAITPFILNNVLTDSSFSIF